MTLRFLPQTEVLQKAAGNPAAFFRTLRRVSQRHDVARMIHATIAGMGTSSSAAAQAPAAAANIFLVGLMGAGKTTVGRVLAKRFGKTFYDCDQEIERRTGVKIPVIFDIEGEDGFRAREAAALRDLVVLENIVLATGGGAVLLPENRRLLTSNGSVVYLRASPADLWHRTRHDRNRPLLQTPDPRGKLEELYLQRDPLYREVATLTVDTGNQSVRSLAYMLEQRLREHFQRPCRGGGEYAGGH
jgi:shikimate kinase